MSSVVVSRGMLTVFEIAPERNGWAAAIIRTWACQAIERLPLRGCERTIEHGEVLFLHIGRAFDRVVLVDVGQDRADLRLIVADRAERERHGLVDDLEHAAAGELLVLHEGDVRLDAGGVAIHHEADRAGRGEHRGLRVAEAVHAAGGEHIVPQCGGPHLAGTAGQSGLISSTASRCICITRSIGSRFFSYVIERTDRFGELAAGEVGRTVQQRGDRTADAAALRRESYGMPAVISRLPRFE